MTSLHDVRPTSFAEKEPWDPTLELLFREAKRRERRRRARKLLLGVSIIAITAGAIAFGVSTAGPSATRPRVPASVLDFNGVKVITCSGASVVRPRTLVVSCADANTLLTSTRWTTWTATAARGTTTFAMNLCRPTCAASRLSYFPHSAVSLTAPVASKRGSYFSRLSVRYVMGSTATTFDFSWQGETPR